ncbi:sugar-binding transcriptional regulator [Pseudactinotalea sp.]|uniref:sugar-binding transcriptional regulator n=1 Tax=Pseudactinotalea sp. TaxID=1926260 RepID=UPI003B3A7D4F
MPARVTAAARRTMMEVSKAYFLDGRTKVQIADDLGLSRFQVARALTKAREVGIVTISLASGAPMPKLSERLRRHLRLERAHVVEAYGDENSLRIVVGQAAGGVLAERLDDGEVLGLGWGRTLDAMVDRLDHLPAVEVVQLSGHFGADIRNAAAELTRRTVALTGGSAHAIPAPFFDADARAVNALRRHPEVAAVVAGFARITTAVVAVGAVRPRPISIAYSGVPDRFIEQVVQSGAVGEVGGNLFAEDGTVIDSSLWRHTLSVTAEQLRQVPRVVAAAGHPVKAAAVRAVCAAGLPTDLVVDVELAETLLRMPPVLEHARSGAP